MRLNEIHIDSESQLAHLSCQLWRIDSFPSVSWTHHRDLCPAIWSTSRCRPTSFEHVWTISPLLLLPELVEPGFGCLIPSGFFLRETGSSQDQFRLYRPMDFISKMYWIHACLKTVRKKWMPISPALWSHVLVTISGFVWKPGTGTIIFPWNGHLGAH
jgi:hypothetical protein